MNLRTINKFIVDINCRFNKYHILAGQGLHHHHKVLSNHKYNMNSILEIYEQDVIKQQPALPIRNKSLKHIIDVASTIDYGCYLWNNGELSYNNYITEVYRLFHLKDDIFSELVIFHDNIPTVQTFEYIKDIQKLDNKFYPFN